MDKIQTEEIRFALKTVRKVYETLSDVDRYTNFPPERQLEVNEALEGIRTVIQVLDRLDRGLNK